jgi:mannose-6-phosphate isomerase-like protein (cupin superfamily)
MGLSLAYTALMQEFRFMEKARLIWKSYWYYKEKAPFRMPVLVADASDVFVSQMSAFGSVRVLVSPAVAATSFLHVSLLTVQPNCEIAPRKSRSVEFYYVIAGSGLFSQQGVIETARIKVGTGFVVDPGSMRWIANRGSEALILMRASDGGSLYSKRDFDPIRMDPSRKASTLLFLKDGYEQIKGLAKDYTNTSSST